MERTIEFVPHPDFDLPEPLAAVVAIRPASIDSPHRFSVSQPGVAFVGGLVQSALLTCEEERYWFTWMNYLKFRAERNRRLLDLSRPDRSLVNQIELDLMSANEARNHIVQGNLRLIVALAKKLSTSLDQMSDLIGEGMSPLIRSVELFDISLGNRFSTYATWAVRNQMLRWMKRSRRTHEMSLGEDTPSLENLPDKRIISEGAEVSQQQRAEAVRRLLLTLSERERQVVSARFALDGEPTGQSLADIAARIGLSKERVRQIALHALEKLRAEMSFTDFENMS